MSPRPVAEIRDPVHGYVRLTEVERDLIDSPFVQRLRRIHQLAGSYLVYPGAVHTRFEHVVGAMHVAGQIAEQLSKESMMNEEQSQEIRIAALLHDVGHGPFSHMFEEVLAGKSDISHEEISQRIVRETSVKDVLTKNGYSAKKLSSLAVGKLDTCPPFMNEIIAGGLSADMMDYLPRDSYFTGVEYGKVDVQRVIDSLQVSQGHLALDDAALYAFEALLLARYEMFKAVYFHRTVRAAELMLVHAMKLADDALALSDLSDLDSYLELTDEVVLYRLATLKGSAPSLRKAKDLALDFRERRLVKCVFEKMMQRKDPVVGKLFADEATRKDVTAEIAKAAKVDAVHVYIDVPTTPSVPRTYSRESLTEVRLIKGHGSRKGVESVPIDELPLVGSIAGFMDVLRVYTTPKNRASVERAATQVFKGKRFA
ncbi:MAG TPA: HD domain-containing protein [Nitrososphaerales archaeon]|nr:HD domain-containing protein [Nitrososphaerales archaeon]